MRFHPARTAVLWLVLSCPIWAQPAPSGVGNFQQVNEGLYRGAQPSDAGLANLAKLGVKTVIDLRESGARSSHESAIAKSLGLHYVNIPMAGFSAPTQEQVAKVMAIFNDPQAGPVFVHCRRGADRTGTMIAIYRISHDHWNNRKALTEAESRKMARWEFEMKNFILHYDAGHTASPAATEQATAARPRG